MNAPSKFAFNNSLYVISCFFRIFRRKKACTLSMEIYLFLSTMFILHSEKQMLHIIYMLGLFFSFLSVPAVFSTNEVVYCVGTALSIRKLMSITA